MPTDNIKNEDVFQQKLARRARQAKKLRVLAIDDEPSIIELLKTALSALGSFDVSIASSSASALKLIDRQTKPFDCLLIDIQMPGMNGITLCKELRARSDYAETPIIMLTAMSDRKYVDQAFLAGATDYITKPFDFLELRSRMSAAQRLLQERTNANQNAEVARQLKNELDSNHQFNLDDPVTINGVDRTLRFTEFDNYVMQLSHGQLFNSCATAIKILDVEEHYDTLPSSEFRRVLHDVAAGLEETTKQSKDVLCYRGNGIFFCVTHGRAECQKLPSETKLNQIINTIQSQRQGRANIYAVIGERVSLRSLSKSGALNSVKRALENVEARVQTVQDSAYLTGTEKSSHSFDAAEGHLQQRAYERVLRDLFRKESSLGSK
jgi:DNA-binding response OmpR family regulator